MNELGLRRMAQRCQAEETGRKVEMAEEDTEKSKDTQKLLDKVYALLQQTDPNKWDITDKPLTVDVKIPRAMETWERVYSLVTTDGTLVVRSSQPVRSNYVAGGYRLVATAGENYIVEMRAVGWRAEEITEPWRGYMTPDRKCQQLLEGQLAKELFILVRDRITNYESEQKKGFEEKAQEFLKKLPEMIHRMRGEDWERRDPTQSDRRYVAEFGEIKVNVVRRLNMGSFTYSAFAEKGNLRVDGRDSAVARDLYFEIERLQQVSGLLVLGKALEGIGEKKK